MLETSLIDGDMVASAIRTLGAERLIFGSDVPWSVPKVEIEKIASLDVYRDDINKVLYKNAGRLLHED